MIINKADKISKKEAHEVTARSENLKKLRTQMLSFINDWRDELKKSGTFIDADKIMIWIEGCNHGSAKAEQKLFKEGSKLLHNIKSRLHLASIGKQAGQHKSQADRFSDASIKAAGVASAISQLESDKA